MRALAVIGDYIRRVYNNAADDNLFFLAGGVAFSLLLVVVPFILLVVGGLAFLFNQGLDVTRTEIHQIVDLLLPPHPLGVEAPVHDLLDSILRARGPISLFSALGFILFSTRVFGSLRSALSEVFDIEQGRSILIGKLFDVLVTLVATALIIVYMVVTAYLAIATPHGAAIFSRVGLRAEVIGGLGQVLGRVLALAFVVALFYGLYRYLPNRRIRWQPALIGALTTSVLFELARSIYLKATGAVTPGTLYSGSLYVIVSLVFWVYYSAVIFLIGGEVAQAYEVRRVLRLQRETFG